MAGTLERNKEVLNLAETGKSTAYIAELYGMSSGNVSGILKRMRVRKHPAVVRAERTKKAELRRLAKNTLRLFGLVNIKKVPNIGVMGHDNLIKYLEELSAEEICCDKWRASGINREVIKFCPECSKELN